MNIHPSARYDFDTLERELSERVARRLVKANAAPDDPQLVLYTYTQTAVVDRLWDEFVEMSRGLVLHHGRRVVLARPFPKFFNYGERGAEFPNEPFEVYEKMDGSLGILFHDGYRWRFATKGSFTAPQAAWAESALSESERDRLTPGHTYLFEIIYRANRIVVRYTEDALVLLSAYDHDGREYTREQVLACVDRLGRWRACPTHSYDSLAAMKDALATFTSDQEGFVVRFRSGHRLKLKGAEYLRVHKLVSRVTPLALWEAMSNGDDVDAIRRQIPEEFWPDFDQIRELLTHKFAYVIGRVEQESLRFAGKTDKEVGLALSTVHEHARPFIFMRRKDGIEWFSTPRGRLAVFKQFRPTGNVLEGYSASTHLLGAQAGE